MTALPLVNYALRTPADSAGRVGPAHVPLRRVGRFSRVHIGVALTALLLGAAMPVPIAVGVREAGHHPTGFARPTSGATESMVSPAARFEPSEYEAPTEDQKRWAMAMSAIYFEVIKHRHDDLAGRPRTRAWMDAEQRTLIRHFDIHDRTDLLEYLRELRVFRDRRSPYDYREFDRLAKDWLPLDTDRWKRYRQKSASDAEDVHAVEVVIEYGAAFEEKSLLGWDISAYVNICRRAYGCGYMTEEEVWRHLMPAARLAQRTFDSWEDYGLNYLVAYRFRDMRGFYSYGSERWLIFERLLCDPDSPWVQLPWNLDLEPNKVKGDEN